MVILRPMCAIGDKAELIGIKEPGDTQQSYGHKNGSLEFEARELFSNYIRNTSIKETLVI